MAHVNALSRNPLSRIEKAQQDDIKVKIIFDLVEELTDILRGVRIFLRK